MCKALPPHGLRELGVDLETGVAVINALEEVVDIEVGGSSVRIEAVVIGIEGNGFGVGLDGLLVLLLGEGVVTDFLPLLSSALHRLLLVHCKLRLFKMDLRQTGGDK